MTPFQTAIIALLSSVTTPIITLLGLYIKDLIDKQRIERIEKRREARTKELANKIDANTVLTQHGVNRADAAYTEANNVNTKLAQTNQNVADALNKQPGC